MRHLISAIVCVSFGMALAGPASAEDPKRKRAAAHYKQGRAYYDQGVYDKAIDEFKAALELAPAPLLHYHLGRAYQLHGDPREALASYRRFVEADPDNKVADDARAQIATLTKQIEIEDAAAARREREAQAAQRIEEARRLVAAKRWDDAVEAYERAHQVTHDHELLYHIAEARRAEGDRERARDAYQRYLDAAPAGASSEAARKRIAELDVLPEVQVDPQPPPSRIVPPEERPRDRGAGGVKWGWVGVGAVSIAGGAALDLLPDSASNGRLDALDFVPVGLYALGLVAAAMGFL